MRTRFLLVLLLFLFLLLPACTGLQRGEAERTRCPACGYEFDVPTRSGGQ